MDQAAAILDRCPACYASFLEFFCEFTCSPNQASFVTVQDVRVVNQTLAPQINGSLVIVNETLAVNSTVYSLSNQYAERFFNSCRDVKSAATGEVVMQMVFSSANYEQFLAFLGAPGTTNDKSPMLISYEYTQASANLSMTSAQFMRDCNDSDTTYQCSCNDCRWCDGPHCVAHYPQPESQLRLGQSWLDPLNLGMILGALAYLAVLLALWARRAAQRHLPSSLLHVSPSAVRSIQCSRGAARPLLALAALVGILFLVGMLWLLAFAHSAEPSAQDQSGKVHLLDSFWEPWLLALVAALFVALIAALLVAAMCTAPLGSFRFAPDGSEQDLSAAAVQAASGVRAIGDASSATSSSSDYMKRTRASDVSALGNEGDNDLGPDDDDDGYSDSEDEDEDEGAVAAPGPSASAAGPAAAAASSRSPRVGRRRSKKSFSDRFFTALAGVVARWPWLVIALAVLVTGLCAIGITNVHIETDPIKLWVPPDSEVFEDKQRFDSTFGAFYRTQQVIWFVNPNNYNAALNSDPHITNRTNSLLDPAILRVIYKAEQRVQAIVTANNVTWGDLCNRPTNQGCIRMSVTGYFDNAQASNQFTNVSVSASTVKAWITQCTIDTVFSACRSDIGAPMFPKVVFGGFDFAAQDYLNASALITTWLLNNEPQDLDPAMDWEAIYLDVVRDIRADFVANGIPLDLHYSAERSVQDELARSTDADIPTIGISYAVMFLYISLALGRLWPVDRYFLVRTKFVLALSAILLVLFSLAIAVGLVASMGVEVTPIISEVIPFLVLAIGIDNVFILLHTFQRQDRRSYPLVATRLKRTMREVGTSITLASLSEAVAFILGGQTKMPAVRAFAFYSCAAILADYVLQITAFAAVLVLDARRSEAGRVDCCPCFRAGHPEDDEPASSYFAHRLAAKRRTSRQDAAEGHTSIPEHSTGFLGGDEYKQSMKGGEHKKKAHFLLTSASPDPERDDGGEEDSPAAALEDPLAAEGFLQRFMRRSYVPFLLHRVTKMLVLIAFVLGFLFALSYGLHNEQLGLDHKYVVPKDSYLQAYFSDLQNVFAVGPPVYFVIQPSELTRFELPENQNRVCSQSGCSETSVQALIFNQVCDPTAYIAQGPSSWLDDYITWLKIRAPCCRTFKFTAFGFHKGDWCPYDPRFPLGDPLCPQCLQPEQFVTFNNVTRPPPWAFTKFLELFLTQSECSTSCGSCGWGHNADVIWDKQLNRTGATRYMVSKARRPCGQAEAHPVSVCKQ